MTTWTPEQGQYAPWWREPLGVIPRFTEHGRLRFLEQDVGYRIIESEGMTIWTEEHPTPTPWTVEGGSNGRQVRQHWQSKNPQ